MNRLSGITNKSEKGISIATLVVTIIVLIILAGITIWLLFENGLLGNADKAVNIQKISEEKEAIEFAYAEANIDYLNKGTPIYANIMKDKLLYYDDKVETRDLEIEEKEEDDDVLINNENIVGYIEIIFSTGNKYIVAAVDNFNYTIKYNLNGGTLSLPNPETYNSDTETFTLNNPTRNEAEFAGWTGTDLTERTLYVTINKGSKGDREYKANWKGKIYHIIYDANGGENPPEIQSKEIGNEITLSYEKPTREGYTFKGWSTKLYSTEVEYASGATFDKDEDIILYAVWELTNYNIVYDLDGGNVSGNPSSYNINSETFTLNNPTKDNFTFKGWTGTGLNGKQLNVTIQKGSSGNLSFKANYGIVNYIIDEVQYATTLEEAVELASNNSTIKIISDVNDESNQIEINKNIKLQLQGHTIRTSQTINIAENAAVQILSGNIKNDVSTTIINQGTLTIGTLENEVLETPTIEGKNIGVENKGTFNFYDGQIIGEKAIKGRIQNTPEQYFTIINNNGGKEIASLIMISDPVARIDDIYYNSLSKAVERQRTGEIVTLIKGIALDATLNITKDTTIDLNGFSISTTQNSYLISNNSNLELIDSAGGGEIFGTTHDVIENNENANLVINGAAVTIKASGAYNLYKNAIYNCKNAKLELKAGIIKADASYLNCISNNAGIVKITGGTLQATKTNNRGIYNEDATGEAPANGRINIQSGIIDAYYGIYNKASNIEDVNINGGTFTGTYSVYLDGSGNVNINNGDFQVVIYNKNSGKIIFNNGIAKSFTNDANGEIIINDGTITGTIKNTDQGNIKIYGGTIESTIKETITNGSTGTIDINNATIISYHPIVNKSKGTININNSNITYSISEADSKVCYGVSNDSSGSITLENSNIILEKKDNSKKSYGNIYGIYNKTNGRIDLINTSIKVLTNGIATSSNKSIVYGIYNNSGIINYRGTGKIDVKRNLDVSSSYSYSYGVFNDRGTVNIGIKDNNYQKDVLEIDVDDIGLINTNGIITFYDGTISGSTSYNGIINDIESNYKINIENSDKQVMSLISINGDYIAEILETGQRYSTIQDAVNACDTTRKYNIKLIKSTIYFTGEDINIGTGKNILIDVNGSTLKIGTGIINNGLLELTDSNETKGKISINKTVVNNNYLNINGIDAQLLPNDNSLFANNKTGTMDINSSTLSLECEGTSDGSIIAIYNSGSLTINDNTLLTTNSNLYTKAIYNLRGEVNINGGTIETNNQTGAYNIYNEYKLIKDGILINNSGNSDYDVSPTNGNLYFANTSYCTIKVDLTGKSGTYKAKVELLERGSGGYFYATVTDSENFVTQNEKEGQFIYITSAIPDKAYETELEGGQIYYIQLGNTSKSTYVNNIEVYNEDTGDKVDLYDRGTVNISDGLIKCYRNAIYNRGNMNITGGTIQGTQSEVINNGSTSLSKGSEDKCEELIVKNAQINTTGIYALKINEGNTLIENTDITVNNASSTGVYVDKGNVTIKNSNINITVKSSTSSYGYGVNNIDGNVVIEDVEINIKKEKNGTKIYGVYASGESGKTQIKSGNIKSDYYGLYVSKGEVIIGNHEDRVNINSPSIQGEVYGLMKSGGNVAFYDGILKGKTGSISGSINEVTEQYVIQYGEEEEYKTAYLEKVYAVQIEETGNQYYTINEALTDCPDNEERTIKVLIPMNLYDTVEISKDKKIKIDLNNNLVKATQTSKIYNKGTLEIIGNGTLSLPARGTSANPIDLITNEGKLTINDNIQLTTHSNSYTKAIHNIRGEVNINGGTIETNNQTGAYNIYNEYKLIKDGILINNSGNSNYDVSPTNGNLYFANTSYCTIKVDLTGKSGTYKAKVELLERGSGGYFYATVTDSENFVTQNEKEGQFIYITSAIPDKAYETELEGGQIYYIQLGNTSKSTYVNNIEVYNEDTGDKVDLYDRGTVNISDGLIKCYKNAIYNRGNMNITGGTIQGTQLEVIISGSRLTSKSSEDKCEELIIKNAQINTTGIYAIEINEGNTLIENTDIDVNNTVSRAVYVNKGNVTIKNSNINLTAQLSSNSSGYAINNADGNILIEDVNIDITNPSSTANMYGVYASGKLGKTQIVSGNIKGCYSGLRIEKGEVTVGNKANGISTTVPIIQGEKYGLYKTGGTIKYYDGVFKGKTDAIRGSINVLEPHYGITLSTEDTYHKAYLELRTDDEVVAYSNGKYYRDLQDAINDCISEEKDYITLFNGYSSNQTLTIQESQNIVLDVNGYSITSDANATITNNGILQIYDSSTDNTGKIINSGTGNAIINNNELIIGNDNTMIPQIIGGIVE